MRIRNPRHAPEGLERNLSPSMVIATPVPAEAFVTSFVVAIHDPPASDDPALPLGPANPIPPPPSNPGGPSGPA
jgi:hypothetical protein